MEDNRRDQIVYKILNVRPKTSSTANHAKSSSGPDGGEKQDSEKEMGDYNAINSTSIQKPPSS